MRRPGLQRQRSALLMTIGRKGHAYILSRRVIHGVRTMSNVRYDFFSLFASLSFFVFPFCGRLVRPDLSLCIDLGRGHVYQRRASWADSLFLFLGTRSHLELYYTEHICSYAVHLLTTLLPFHLQGKLYKIYKTLTDHFASYGAKNTDTEKPSDPNIKVCIDVFTIKLASNLDLLKKWYHSNLKKWRYGYR